MILWASFDQNTKINKMKMDIFFMVMKSIKKKRLTNVWHTRAQESLTLWSQCTPSRRLLRCCHEPSTHDGGAEASRSTRPTSYRSRRSDPTGYAASTICSRVTSRRDGWKTKDWRQLLPKIAEYKSKYLKYLFERERERARGSLLLNCFTFLKIFEGRRCVIQPPTLTALWQ